MSITTTAYESGSNLIAGWVTTDQIPLAADTYYKGMELEYDAATDAYIALATAANVAAIYNGEDGRVLSSAGYGDAIMGGELYDEGIVDDAGADKAITEDHRAELAANGFYLKRK